MAHRFWTGKIILVLCLGLVVASSAMAQDLTGVWDFTAEVPGTCTWMGPAMFTQTAGALSGDGNLVLTAGTNPPCPPALIGTVAGTIVGTTVNFGLTTIGGPVNFVGATDPAGTTMSGTWMLGALGGTWSATRAPVVPTLPQWAMLALVSVLLLGSVYLLRRRRGSLV